MSENEIDIGQVRERNWLDLWMELLHEAETPKNFIYWSGLSDIAGIVRDKVYLRKRLYQLYPNLFVMMIGKSGLKKSFPVSKAKELVKALKNANIKYSVEQRKRLRGEYNSYIGIYTLPNPI